MDMEQSGGGGAIAARRPQPSPAAAGGGEDRLGALPDDVIVLILLRLDTAAAVRTSVLSSRWRRVWALLPELRFHLAPDGHRIREILDAPEALSLVCISVTTKAAGPEAAAAWLPSAARRLSGDLVYHNMTAPARMKKRGDVLLPCFEKATSIELNMGFLRLALPSLGVFARLAELSLMRVRFRGQCELGDAVSSPRCPCLQKLNVYLSRGLHNLSIHSVSIFNEGHGFGANLFRVLRICTGLRKLSLVLRSSSSLECLSDCPCDEPTSWKTEELLLNHLEDIRILNLKGADHEVAFLKQLFKWATVLKKMTIAFDYQVSKSKAEEFRQALAGSSRPETFVGFYMYQDADKRVLVLIKPEDQGTGL
ncbi:unnamed protein product [Urochloa decumbens]|uniref:F-box domain-containing protein n=1 Tax=Urochloa decumbens TaxID=240449 RepID=A0ABC9FMQ4_9POAL